MKVFVALRFYASGSFQGVIADTFVLSQPSVSRAISDVSASLVKRAGNYITFPKEPKLSEIKGNLYSVANFPGVILPQHLNFHYFSLFMTNIHTTVASSSLDRSSLAFS
jgi:hypothetical protein